LTARGLSVSIFPMLKIRLQRVGRKHDPSFRVVLTDKRNGPQSGKFLEILGSYNARFGTPSLKGDRIKYWIDKGAKPSDTVHNLLISEKIIEGKKINVLPKKSPIVKEVAEEDKKEATMETPTDTAENAETPAEVKSEEAPAKKEKTAEEKPSEEVPAEEEKKEESSTGTEEKKEESSSIDASQDGAPATGEVKEEEKNKE